MLLFCLIMTLCKHKVGRVAKYRRFSHVNHFQLWVLKDNISIPTPFTDTGNSCTIVSPGFRMAKVAGNPPNLTWC